MEMSGRLTVEIEDGFVILHMEGGEPQRLGEITLEQAEDAGDPLDFRQDGVVDSVGEAAAWLASRWMLRYYG